MKRIVGIRVLPVAFLLWAVFITAGFIFDVSAFSIIAAASLLIGAGFALSGHRKVYFGGQRK